MAKKLSAQIVSFFFRRVVDGAFEMANIRREDLTAIAVTTKPGLSGSLR